MKNFQIHIVVLLLAAIGAASFGQQNTGSNLTMPDGRPAYLNVGDKRLLHPQLLFDRETIERMSRPSPASQAAETKAETAKVDLSAAIAIIQKNGGFTAENQQAIAALKKSETRIAELQQLTKQVEAERVARTMQAGEQTAIANQYYEKLKEVEARSLELEEQAAQLESREHFFSTGFYASLAAIAIGVVGFFMQLPTVMLDRELKRLELVKMQRELSEESEPSETLKPVMSMKRQAA